MSRIFAQTDVAAGCGEMVACSGAILGINTMPRECLEGGTYGTTGVNVSVPGSSSNRAGIMFQSPVGVPGKANWEAGDWVVRINHTGNVLAGVTWEAVYICRINSACGTVSTVGSLTGIGQSVTGLGVYTRTVSGGASSGTASDMFYVVCVFDNSNSSTRTLVWTPNQDIDTPILEASQTIEPTGIASTATFGTPQVKQKIMPVGIASVAVFGSPRVVLGLPGEAPAFTLYIDQSREMTLEVEQSRDVTLTIEQSPEIDVQVSQQPEFDLEL